MSTLRLSSFAFALTLAFAAPHASASPLGNTVRQQKADQRMDAREEKAGQRADARAATTLLRTKMGSSATLLASHTARLAGAAVESTLGGALVGIFAAHAVTAMGPHAMAVTGAATTTAAAVALYHREAKVLARTATVKQGVKAGTFTEADARQMEKAGIIRSNWRNIAPYEGLNAVHSGFEE